MHPADPSLEEGSPTDAGPQDDSSSGTSASDTDVTSDAAANELPFGADQPGFTDWRVELRERLKKIRARRESEQEEADEGADEAEVLMLDDIGLDVGEVEESLEEDLPELERALNQSVESADIDDPIVDQEGTRPFGTVPGDDNVVELADILEGPDLPLETDAIDLAAETVELLGPGETLVAEVPVVEADGEDYVDEQVIAELRDKAEEIAGEAADDLSEMLGDEEPAERAAAGKATTGWDSDLIAGLQAGAAAAPQVDEIAESLDPVAGMELSSPEQPQSLEDAPEADEDHLVDAEEIDAEEIAIQQIAAEDLLPTGEVMIEEEALGEAVVEEIEAIEEIGAGEVFEALEETEAVEEIEAVAGIEDEALAAETYVHELDFDEVETSVLPPSPDLELDIEEFPASADGAGLEWDTPSPPELMRPATSGLDQFAAPLGQRAIAGIADALVLVIIAGVLVGAAGSATGATYDALLTGALLPLALVWGIFAFGYFVFFTGTCGQTIGKMIMKLRVVSTDQLSVGFGRATKRLIASVPSILVLGIGFFLALRDPKRRTVYDRIAQTRVVRA